VSRTPEAQSSEVCGNKGLSPWFLVRVMWRTLRVLRKVDFRHRSKNVGSFGISENLGEVYLPSLSSILSMETMARRL
jgi:hypothetical protein